METLSSTFVRTTELQEQDPVHDLHHLPVPARGPDPGAPGVSLDGIEALRDSADENEGGVFGYLALFTGSGAVLNLFGLGILPYITSSIVIQILTVAVPKLEEWQSQGAVGQRKITQWTRYIAIILALVQSARASPSSSSRSPEQIFGYDPGLFPDGVVRPDGPGRHLCDHRRPHILMWMGELITEKGLGNGMSVLIFASVVAGLPVARRADLPGPRRDLADRRPRRPGDAVPRHRVHRAGPAPDPHQLPQAGGRPSPVRRQQDLHPAQGQPGRRHPRDLRQLAVDSCRA